MRIRPELTYFVHCDAHAFCADHSAVGQEPVLTAGFSSLPAHRYLFALYEADAYLSPSQYRPDNESLLTRK